MTMLFISCKAEGAPAPVTMISLLDDNQETPVFDASYGERITSVVVTQEIESVTEKNEGRIFSLCNRIYSLARTIVKAKSTARKNILRFNVCLMFV